MKAFLLLTLLAAASATVVKVYEQAHCQGDVHETFKLCPARDPWANLCGSNVASVFVPANTTLAVYEQCRVNDGFSSPNPRFQQLVSVDARTQGECVNFRTVDGMPVSSLTLQAVHGMAGVCRAHAWHVNKYCVGECSEQCYDALEAAKDLDASCSRVNVALAADAHDFEEWTSDSSSSDKEESEEEMASFSVDQARLRELRSKFMRKARFVNKQRSGQQSGNDGQTPEQSADQSSPEQSADQSAEQNADQSAEQNADQSAEQNADQSAEQNADQSAEQNADQSAEQNADQSAEQNADQSAEQSADQSDNTNNNDDGSTAGSSGRNSDRQPEASPEPAVVDDDSSGRHFCYRKFITKVDDKHEDQCEEMWGGFFFCTAVMMLLLSACCCLCCMCSRRSSRRAQVRQATMTNAIPVTMVAPGSPDAVVLAHISPAVAVDRVQPNTTKQIESDYALALRLAEE